MPPPAATTVSKPAAQARPRPTKAHDGADSRSADDAVAPAATAAPTAQGLLQLAVSPWGLVEIDGKPAGTTPPLSRLNLPEGEHTVVIRNEDFPAHSVTIKVAPDQPVTIRHRFGS